MGVIVKEGLKLFLAKSNAAVATEILQCTTLAFEVVRSFNVSPSTIED